MVMGRRWETQGVLTSMRDVEVMPFGFAFIVDKSGLLVPFEDAEVLDF